MKYYRVLKKHADTPLVRALPNGKLEFAGNMIAGELFTEREAQKYSNLLECSELVEIKKSMIYKAFDCRFAN